MKQQTRNLDVAHEIAMTIFADVESRVASIRTEEDAKVQIITRVLTEVLGWNLRDIAAESLNQNGFSDYLVCDGSRKAFVLEAKKIGEITLGTRSCGRI